MIFRYGLLWEGHVIHWREDFLVSQDVVNPFHEGADVPVCSLVCGVKCAVLSVRRAELTS